jgi:hypothetical protein
VIQNLIRYNEKLKRGDLPIKPGQAEQVSEAAGPNDHYAQGDLYFRLIDDVPEGYTEVTPFLKMVPGETVGSRHCWADLPERLWVPEGWDSQNYTGLLGPIALVRSNVLQHAEHGNYEWDFLLERLTEFRYQRDEDAEERERRRQD